VTGHVLDLAALGWDDTWQRAAAAYAEVGEPGRIVRVDRGICKAITVSGPVRATLGSGVLEAVGHDPVDGPCTGDWCVLRSWPDGPITVEAMLPRRTLVTRAEAARGSRAQALAANADYVAVVVALHPEPSLARIERLLTIAWDSGAEPLVVLTKADVAVDAAAIADDVADAAPGARVIVTSTATGSGIADVRALAGSAATLALVGASGHGKSSLANALIAADSLAVRPLRADGKGRHTSVRRELLALPGGGAVIDTPGLRGVGVLAADDAVAAAFADIDEIAHGCRFADCSHGAEPGCAVRAAVGDGRVTPRRLESWRSLTAERARLEARAKARTSKLPTRLADHKHRRGKRP
jgi:ribosome biogenesis GTPase / thiamine phosphate phosphatase